MMPQADGYGADWSLRGMTESCLEEDTTNLDGFPNLVESSGVHWFLLTPQRDTARSCRYIGSRSVISRNTL